MSKLKNTILVTILDWMIFLASFNIQEKKYSFIIAVVCIVIMMVLSKIILDIIIESIEKRHNLIDSMFVELKNNSDQNGNLVIDKINEVNMQNEKLLKELSETNKDMSDNLLSSIKLNKELISNLKNYNLEINKILENNISSMSDEILKYQNQNVEIVKNIEILLTQYNEKLLDNIKSMNTSLENNINTGTNNIIDELLNNNKKLSEDITNSIQKVDNIVDESNKVISRSFSDISLEIKNNNEGSIGRLDELSKNITSNLQDMGVLFDGILRRMEDTIKNQNEKNNRELNRSIEGNVKKLKKEISEGNNQSIEILESMKEEQIHNIEEVKYIVQKITGLQQELLKAMDDNQKKMLELNEEDINLMKEMIR